jgi:uncharacterized protein YfdQ (DUF2303 family)
MTNHWGDPYAELELQETIPLAMIRDINGATKSLAMFESWLNDMKPFLGEGALDMLGRLKDFQVNKITKMERKKERNGNYHFLISKASAEKEDFEPPETLIFKVPVFEHLDHEMDITFEFWFDFSLTDDGPSVTFKLFNPLLREAILKRQKEIMVKELKDVNEDISRFWGNAVTIERTDSWKYKQNTISL